MSPPPWRGAPTVGGTRDSEKRGQATKGEHKRAKPICGLSKGRVAEHVQVWSHGPVAGASEGLSLMPIAIMRVKRATRIETRPTQPMYDTLPSVWIDAIMAQNTALNTT